MIDFQNLTDIQNQSLMEEVENQDMKKLLNTLTEGLLVESQLDPDFFQFDNSVKKSKNQQRNIVTQK